MTPTGLTLTFTAAELSALCPFWVVVGPGLEIEDLGPGLRRLWGDSRGEALVARLELRRPTAADTVAALCEARGPLLFQARGEDLPFQGLALARGAGALLLLAPVADATAKLRSAGLRLSDLGVLDSSPSHLMRDQLLRTTLGDAQTLAVALRERNEELESLRRAAEAARDAAERLAAARADFLATMSHELRTPLNGIEGTIELLGLQSLGPTEAELHRVLARSARNLREIVDDVLDLAKLEAGQMEVRAAPFAVADVVAGVVDDYLAMARERGLRLTHEAGCAPPLLNGDARLLRQILSNLVSNALKFTPAGQVVVGWDFETDDAASVSLHLWVDDTGPGVPEALREVIFDAFRQLDVGANRTVEGTGLGLSICRHLAATMRATLDCVGSPLGGARFSLRLVLPAVASVGRDADAAPAPVERLDGLRILVVDDNAVNQFVARQLLESLGASVQVVGGGAEAVAAWRAHRPDICLMDLMMPEVDGPEVTRWIRALPDGWDSPILALSAGVMPDDRAVCLEARMEGFVNKPISRAEIGRVIRESLAARRPR